MNKYKVPLLVVDKQGELLCNRLFAGAAVQRIQMADDIVALILRKSQQAVVYYSIRKTSFSPFLRRNKWENERVFYIEEIPCRSNWNSRGFVCLILLLDIRCKADGKELRLLQ